MRLPGHPAVVIRNLPLGQRTMGGAIRRAAGRLRAGNLVLVTPDMPEGATTEPGALQVPAGGW